VSDVDAEQPAGTLPAETDEPTANLTDRPTEDPVEDPIGATEDWQSAAE
jgi:hypothetical protein